MEWLQKLLRGFNPIDPHMIVRRNLIYKPEFRRVFEVFDEPDYIKAREMFEEAADQSDAEAQHNLGVVYETATGLLVRDDETAEYWYRKASEQGLANAQFNLAAILAADLMAGDKPELVIEPFRPDGPISEAYEERHERYVEAYMWLLCAEAQGHDLAKESRSRLQQVMTVEQIEEAELQYAISALVRQEV